MTDEEIYTAYSGEGIKDIRPRKTKTYALTRGQLKLLSSILEDESETAEDEEMLELANRLKRLAIRAKAPTITFTLVPAEQRAVWFTLNDVVGLYPVEFTKDAETATEAKQTMAIGRAMSKIASKLEMPLTYKTGTAAGAKRYAERTFK